jgi:hypothetical protein
MDRDPWEKPSLFRWRNRTPHTRADPRDDQIGLGKGKHPLLLLLAVWAAGIALMVGLSLVLPRSAAGLADLVIIIGLLLMVRI